MRVLRRTVHSTLWDASQEAAIPRLVRLQPSDITPISTLRPEQVPALIPCMNRTQRRQYSFLLALWLLNLTIFWVWWLQQAHITTIVGLVLTSLLIVWATLVPAYFVVVVLRMRRPNPALPLPQGDVAIIVTKSPSEPWAVVQRTLEAMQAQAFPRPFDVWLADEDPAPETERWCHEHDVKISTRRDVPAYHRPSWPRRTRCKEGNLAYFYDHWGYLFYDFVVQLDADHVPEPGYLEAMILPFGDRSVGYVAAPSICDANANVSWVARARLYGEASKHGPLQAGYNGGLAPLCIGSHYAVRTRALQDIGGLGPELAEDHSTTLLMQAGGWKGVFALDAIAHGEGPSTFVDAMTQEFQWSRSLTQILLTVTPACWRALSWPLRAQFLFAQLWYLLFGGYMVLAYVLPLLALLTRTPWVNVNVFIFLWHFTQVTAVLLMSAVWLRLQGWFRPTHAKVISWEIIVFELARWPWVIAGVCAALVNTLTRSHPDFRVTPKGTAAAHTLPGRMLLPYLLLIGAACACATLIPTAGSANGYYYFTVYNSLAYFLVMWTITLCHVREARASQRSRPSRRITGPVVQVLLASVLVILVLLTRESQVVNVLV